jgi:alcohol dehydrogenase, propanol-preferring
MKAMVLTACAPIVEAPLRRVEWPDPQPGVKEVRVRVTACGICRTDLHVIEGELPALDHPVIPGHQIVGEVDALGPGSSRFRIGERIGIAWLRHTCGDCTFCREGKENLCEGSLFTGYHAPGGFAEYAVVPEDFAYAIPGAFTDAEAAPLLCGGIIGYRSLRRSQVRPGQTLGLYGFGSSAHIVLQIARYWGCEVYVCTRQRKHQELALRLGAKWAGSRTEEMPVQTDSAIIFAPAGSLVPKALARLSKGGTLALAGIYMTDIPEMAYEAHLFYEKNVRSVTANTRQDAVELLQLAAKIPIRPTVQTFPMEQANEALLKLKRDEINGTGVLVCSHGAVGS